MQMRFAGYLHIEEMQLIRWYIGCTQICIGGQYIPRLGHINGYRQIKVPNYIAELVVRSAFRALTSRIIKPSYMEILGQGSNS